MTILEVQKALEEIVKGDPEALNKQLEIPIIAKSIGPRAATQIRAICPGIDWDSSRIFIYTEKVLQEAEIK